MWKKKIFDIKFKLKISGKLLCGLTILSLSISKNEIQDFWNIGFGQ